MTSTAESPAIHESGTVVVLASTMRRVCVVTSTEAGVYSIATKLSPSAPAASMAGARVLGIARPQPDSVDTSVGPSKATTTVPGVTVDTWDMSPSTSTPPPTVHGAGVLGGTTRGALASSSDSSHASEARSRNPFGFTGTIDANDVAVP